MALARAPKLRQSCRRLAAVPRRTHVVLASSFKAGEPGNWKHVAEEPVGNALDWVKPEFDMDSFCLKKEIRKFSKQLATGSIDADDEQEVAVPLVDRFSFKLPLYYKPDFATMRPFWHELL